VPPYLLIAALDKRLAAGFYSFVAAALEKVPYREATIAIVLTVCFPRDEACLNELAREWHL
jgi:hypothetical protein